MNFLFWNIGNSVSPDIIARLARRHQVDVLMFAESHLTPGDLLIRLNDDSDEFHYSGESQCKQIAIYSRFPSEFIKPISESRRMTIRRLSIPGKDDILLAVVHLRSKLHQSGDSQNYGCVELSQAIYDAEKEQGHDRTCLVGDFNANPFEEGMVATRGLHAVMSRRVAERGTRKVDERDYKFFYNPMWGHLGDATDSTEENARYRPPGTYYAWRSEHVNFFWNAFDQVMVRPKLLSRFSNHHVQILTSDGVQSFVSDDGTPDKNVASDHLPLLFSVDI
jgi:hypothetical protein